MLRDQPLRDKGKARQMILGSRYVKVHLDDFNKIVTRHIDQTRPLHEEKHDDDHQIYLKYSTKCGHDSIQLTPDIIPLRRSTRKAKPPLRFQCELLQRRAHKSKRRRCYGLNKR
ncbi:hypothetical protein RF11_03496 [Thelohanellus kitauei]|uniref:Uncharacterized protein n=1 Tax=Thelohanellus kitauei TaxID=669202 RepID=A0A0C2IJ65_THEKT|nr:hypothetical protein RF11_03496 [Thelohanellus kitauei]